MMFAIAIKDYFVAMCVTEAKSAIDHFTQLLFGCDVCFGVTIECGKRCMDKTFMASRSMSVMGRYPNIGGTNVAAYDNIACPHALQPTI